MPPVVLEVLVGIVVGPQVLGLVRAEGAAEVLYLLGLGFLLFLAGQDVRPERFRGPTFRLAGTAFLVSMVLAVPVAFGLHAIAPGADVRLLARAWWPARSGCWSRSCVTPRRSPPSSGSSWWWPGRWASSARCSC